MPAAAWAAQFLEISCCHGWWQWKDKSKQGTIGLTYAGEKEKSMMCLEKRHSS